MPHPTRKAPYIGKYRLGREIGSGGSATVHLAFDAQLGRWVALKVLHERFIRQPIRVADFLTQAHHTARLDHPNVVAVLDIDTRARRPWIAMEFLSGRSLAATLRARRSPGKAAAQPFELAEALRMVRDVSAGLAHAHRHSVIHYDVSPGNVMQAPCGGLTLIDFGLPPLRRHRQGSAAAIRGTTHFMAPEQVVDDPGTPATDVYAAGCLLYALVTGVPPFLGPDAGAVMRSHLNDTPRSARDYRPDLPVWVDDVFGTLLAKKPTDRPLDGTALYELLDEASRKLSPGAPPGCGAHSGQRTVRPEALDAQPLAVRTSSTRRPQTTPQVDANAAGAPVVPEPDHGMFSEPDLAMVAGAPAPRRGNYSTDTGQQEPAHDAAGSVDRADGVPAPVKSPQGEVTAARTRHDGPETLTEPETQARPEALGEPETQAEPGAQVASERQTGQLPTDTSLRDTSGSDTSGNHKSGTESKGSEPVDTVPGAAASRPTAPRHSERRAAKAARLAAEQRAVTGSQSVASVILPDTMRSDKASSAAIILPRTEETHTAVEPAQDPINTDSSPGAMVGDKPVETRSENTTKSAQTSPLGRSTHKPHLPDGTPTTGQMRVKAPKGRPTIIPDIDVCVEPVRVVDELSPKTTPAA